MTAVMPHHQVVVAVEGQPSYLLLGNDQVVLRRDGVIEVRTVRDRGDFLNPPGEHVYDKIDPREWPEDWAALLPWADPEWDEDDPVKALKDVKRGG